MKARRFLTIMAVAAGVLWALGAPAVRADVAAGATQPVEGLWAQASVTLPAGWQFRGGDPGVLMFQRGAYDIYSSVLGTFKVDWDPDARGIGPAEQQISILRHNYAAGLYGTVKDVSEPEATTMGGKPAFGFHANMSDQAIIRYIIVAGGDPESVYTLIINATYDNVGSALMEQIDFIRESIKYGK